MNTDAARKASREYHARRTDSGMRKVTFWLTPAGQKALDKLKNVYGSKEAALEAAILALAQAMP